MGVVLICLGIRFVYKKFVCILLCSIFKFFEVVDIEGFIYFLVFVMEIKLGCGMRCCFILYKVFKC